MLCGLVRKSRKSSRESNTLVATRPAIGGEYPLSYSKIPVPDQNKRGYPANQSTNNQSLQGLYAQRQQLLNRIEDEPYTVQQAKWQFEDAVFNYGKAGWGEEGRREYNRAERRYQMIEARHRQHQRKLKEIEKEIYQLKARSC